MKFRLTQDHVFSWPIKISIPDPDKAGDVVIRSFNMTFRAMPLAEAHALDAAWEKMTPKEQTVHQDDVLRRVCIGWDDGVVGDDRKPVPFSSEALEQALQFSWFRLGVYRAFRDAMDGRGAAEGN